MECREQGKCWGVYKANLSRPDVNRALGIVGDHGFNVAFNRTVPSESILFDGLPHKMYIIGKDTTNISSNDMLLGNSPQLITCLKNQLLGDATITSGALSLTTKGANAGGIVMLTHGGFEVMNMTIDRGVGIQTAWQNNNGGECFNPTHQGAQSDGIGPTTTNSISLQVNPAYWLHPGESSPYCNFDNNWKMGNGTAINTSLVSDSVLSQKFVLNPSGYNDVLEVDGLIKFGNSDTSIRPLNFIIIEQPTVILVNKFTKSYRYDLQTDTLSLNTQPADIYSHLYRPAILTTDDETEGVAMYTNQIPPEGWKLNNGENIWVGYGLGDQRNLWGFWTMNTRVPYYASNSTILAGDNLATRSYILLGNLNEIKSNLHKLYLEHPSLPASCLSRSFNNVVPEINDCNGMPTPTSTKTPAISGDANGNGKVDLADFSIWKDEYLGKLTTNTADFNKSGVVDLGDFGVWKKAYLNL